MHTNPNQLLPVGVIDVRIQYLLPVVQRHPSEATRDIVQGCPQCLNYFPIDLLGSLNVAGRIPGQA
jgi:hypothetical protein